MALTSAYPGIAYPGVTYPGFTVSEVPAPPAVTVEIAFDSPALSAAPVWTDVTDWVRAIDVSRGRNMELSQFEAGSLTVTLDNEDGRFTPRQTPNAGQPRLRPRRPMRVTAVYNSVTYPVAYGIIERWPASIGDGAFMVSVPATDAFRVLSDFKFPESDTGWLTKAKPRNYWPLQETSIDTYFAFADIVGGRNAWIIWSGTSGRPDSSWSPQAGAASNLPSGSGVALDLKGFAVDPVSGNYATNAIGMDPTFNFAPGSSFTLTAQCIIPNIAKADGSYAVLMSTTSALAGVTRDIVSVKPDGSVLVLGRTVAPAGSFKTYTNYRVTISFQRVSTGPTVYRSILALNGDVYTDESSLYPLDPAGEYLTFGGRGYSDGGASSGRWSHLALWDRALTATEVLLLWSDYMCAPGLTADTRMNRALDLIGFPSGLRDLQVGKSTLVRDSWTDDSSVLSLMQKWAQADNGMLYIGDDGKVTYRNRHARLIASPIPAFTFDCGADTGVESGLEWVMDEDDVTNVVNLNVSYGRKAQYRDEASIADYGEKPFDMNLDIQSSDEGTDAAKHRLSLYAQPVIRVSSITIDPASSPGGNLWAAALSADIGTLIRLANLPVQAPASQLDYFIESVKHTIVRDGGVLRWLTTFDVSPAPPSAWVLGDSSRSVLGSTTRPAY